MKSTLVCIEVMADYLWARANRSPANLHVAPVDPRVIQVHAQIYFGPWSTS